MDSVILKEIERLSNDENNFTYDDYTPGSTSNLFSEFKTKETLEKFAEFVLKNKPKSLKKK